MSNSVCIVFDSSTVTTPSLPTRSIASEINSPISRSLLAETLATLARSALFLTFFACRSMSATAASTPN